jgi:hypothetical protein
MCEGLCHCVDPCVELSRNERTAGFDEGLGQYTYLKSETDPRAYGFLKSKIDPRGRFCSVCDRPIATLDTVPWSFKGMLAMHLKWKHPETFREYKKGIISLDDVYYQVLE